MFDGRYRTIIADTVESKAIHFKLRYEVYCLEKRFEPTEHFNTSQERDDYDANAIHLLVQHKTSGQWVGAIRLVLGRPGSLPIYGLTSVSLPKTIMEEGGFAELSRLAILKSFRRCGKETRVSEPEVLLGLIRAAKEYSENHGIRYWLFLCRRSIKRVVGSFGMEMDVIGPPCEFRGIRYPFLATLATAFDGVAGHSDPVVSFFAKKHTLLYYSKLYPGHSHNLAA